MTTAFTRALRDTAAAPYLSAGYFAWCFALGKLGGDPAFRSVLERGLIPDSARILDLGCGQGLLAAWLLSARALFEAGHWPARWPAAPKPMAYRGIELMPREVRRARLALGKRAEFVLSDMRTADFGRSDAVVILDALHYMDYFAQDDVLSRVRDALVPRGGLLMRVGDPDGGLAFTFSNWVDHLVAFGRSRRLSRLYCRSPARLARLAAPARLHGSVGADESRYALCQCVACC